MHVVRDSFVNIISLTFGSQFSSSSTIHWEEHFISFTCKFFAQSRHRLSSSYDFSTPARSLPSAQSHPSYEPQYSESPPHLPQSNHLDDDTYTYFDPWDEFVEQIEVKAPQESCQNFNSSLDNYVDTNSGSEVNYSDHHTQCSDNRVNNEFNSDFSNSFIVFESIKTPHTGSSNHINDHNSGTVHFNNTEGPPTVEISSESFHSYVPVNDGGGDTNLWNRPSIRESFSQPNRSISAPELTVPDCIPESRTPENHVVVDTHSHAPPPCESTSVVSLPDVRVTHTPSPEPDVSNLPWQRSLIDYHTQTENVTTLNWICI